MAARPLQRAYASGCMASKNRRVPSFRRGRNDRDTRATFKSLVYGQDRSLDTTRHTRARAEAQDQGSPGLARVEMMAFENTEGNHQILQRCLKAGRFCHMTCAVVRIVKFIPMPEWGYHFVCHVPHAYQSRRHQLYKACSCPKWSACRPRLCKGAVLPPASNCLSREGKRNPYHDISHSRRAYGRPAAPHEIATVHNVLVLPVIFP